MWIYKGKPLKQVPDGYLGFLYLITNKVDGRIYVGKKQFTTKAKHKISKREKTATKTRKRYKVTVKESNWQDYNSSCKELIDDFNRLGVNCFEKTILDFAKTKADLTFLEVMYQFNYNVLEVPSYNGNILGRFFKTR